MIEKVYVTPDEFKNDCYGGFDLREALADISFSTSITAEMFIALVTRHLKRWIDRNSFRNFNWNAMPPRQLEYWKQAIIAQANYTYREGAKAFGMFSGTDDEHGRILDIDYIEKVTVCPLCMDTLIDGGLFNSNIQNRRRTWSGGDLGGFY